MDVIVNYIVIILFTWLYNFVLVLLNLGKEIFQIPRIVIAF